MQRFSRLKASPQFLTFLIHLGASIIFGLIWYLILYGRYHLYFSHVNWIYNAGGDVLQHQLGLEWFRNEPWRFPLGSIQAYGYPFGTSISFMDSILLFAIPFKLLSPLLGQNFQYFGLWELTSVVLQMLMGILILHQFTRSYPLKVLGASMLVLAPPMIFCAFYHSSLSAHWILLAGIWFVLLEYRHKLWRHAWIVLFGVALMVHLYFIPMLIPLWLISLFFRYSGEPKRWKVIIDLLAVAGVILLLGYCTGLFGLEYKFLAVSGYGVYSWNLNGFFNPFHFSSAYMKELPTGTGGQFEGFSYLGLGNLLILPAALFLFPQKDFSRRRLVFLLLFSFAALLYILFALTHQAYLNSWLLWNITLPEAVLRFLCLFRTSGRFIWPVFYFLVLFGLASIIRNIRFAAPVLLLAVLLQWSDLQPLYGSKQLDGFTKYQSPMQSQFWQAAADNNEHVVLLPVKKITVDEELVLLFAAHNNLTINAGYFARSDTHAIRDYADQAWKDLQANLADNATLYILSDPQYSAYAHETLAGFLPVCEVDGYTVVFSPQNKLLGTDLAPYCTLPAP